VLAASDAPGMAPLAEALRAALKSKHVVIGSSSAALGDYVQTPLGRLAGVKMQAMTAQLLLGGHVLKPRAFAWEASMAVGALLLVLVAGAPRWRGRGAVQWGVLPLVLVFTVAFGAMALSRGQAVGLLFAMSTGVLAHLMGVLYQQVQLFRQNQRLEMEKRAAQQADALKSQFLSHITHELRTPLTAIMGFNNINWHDSALGREQRMKNGEIVDRNCQHMLSLVNNLLDQAKIEAGQLTIQRHPDSARSVVRDAVTTVQPLLRGKPVALKTDDVGVPEMLEIDAFRLRQIVLNLLSNAIKFTDKGEISVVSSWSHGELTLAVVDTGPGMSEDAVKRLFTAFQQADGSVAAKHGGTGLGLTISRNLARLMGGDIKVRSAPGQGTVFTVTVAAPAVGLDQAASAAPVSAASAVSQGAVASGTPRAELRALLQGVVLLAEDMPDTRALVVRHLERLGLTVLQAENGEQAIEAALSKRPDVVLMDMDMPVVAGSEATRTLRMCGFSAPILALTAHKGEEERTRALAAGCNSIVEKPMTRASLLAALSEALAPSAAASAKQ
jgi:signal transduction histidine kinase/CheY-like chemotaxis protein